MAASEPFLGDVFPEMNSHAILANKRSLLLIPWSPRRHSIPDPRSSSVMSPLLLILLSDFVVGAFGHAGLATPYERLIARTRCIY
jgi:hypothetical protein